jgi:hypothetical protein
MDITIVVVIIIIVVAVVKKPTFAPQCQSIFNDDNDTIF